MTEGSLKLYATSFAKFLESLPPNELARIPDLVEPHKRGSDDSISYSYYLKTPDLQLHCSNDTCNGLRFFRYKGNTNTIPVYSGDQSCIYLEYHCSNCGKTSKIYSIAAESTGGNNSYGTCIKFGELPAFGPPTPSRLIKLIGPDRETFLKGRRCENQGLGIGAFIYYRRVVENQKDRILKEIIKVSEKLNTRQDILDVLNKALEETQFSQALDIAKEAMPESLLINGHNPLRLLHGALSRGVHNQTDEECLKLASSVRVVLGELADRLSQALKDEAELSEAISTLMAKAKR